MLTKTRSGWVSDSTKCGTASTAGRTHGFRPANPDPASEIVRRLYNRRMVLAEWPWHAGVLLVSSMHPR